MPVHAWRRVDAGIYHHFHTNWITELGKRLNDGLLPGQYYALVEQTAGETGPDVLALQGENAAMDPTDVAGGAAVAVTVAPPKVSYRASLSEEDVYTRRRRTLAIRHVSGDRVVAYIEILSPGNKSSRAALDRFLDKAVAVLNHGCHLLLVDLFPPGTFDPLGMHQAIWSQFCRSGWQQPEDKPLTLAAYTGGLLPEAYVEPIAVGAVLPDMPLFLQEDWYVNVPLEATYQDAFTTMPRRWREVIERPDDARPV
jgi:hypothetical protein